MALARPSLYSHTLSGGGNSIGPPCTQTSQTSYPPPPASSPAPVRLVRGLDIVLRRGAPAVAPPSVVPNMPPSSPTSSHHHAPLLLTLSLIFHDIIFLTKLSRYHFSDKILEISLVLTNGITLAWVNHNRCFVKKCILMFLAMHGHLASP